LPRARKDESADADIEFSANVALRPLAADPKAECFECYRLMCASLTFRFKRPVSSYSGRIVYRTATAIAVSCRAGRRAQMIRVYKTTNGFFVLRGGRWQSIGGLISSGHFSGREVQVGPADGSSQGERGKRKIDAKDIKSDRYLSVPPGGRRASADQYE
jgi:hypothetical protein